MEEGGGYLREPLPTFLFIVQHLSLKRLGLIKAYSFLVTSCFNASFTRL